MSEVTRLKVSDIVGRHMTVRIETGMGVKEILCDALTWIGKEEKNLKERRE